MERFVRDFEQVFVDAAMAEEGGDFLFLANNIHTAAETFECSSVDVTFAEAGEFTETACVPQQH